MSTIRATINSKNLWAIKAFTVCVAERNIGSSDFSNSTDKKQKIVFKMKFLFVLFALIAAAFAAPQFGKLM